MKNLPKIILCSIVIIVALYWGLLILFGFPIPRGTRWDSRYNSYYKNAIGIYYISVDHPLALINHGHWGYLDGADEETFVVLDGCWAKDKNAVWYEDRIMRSADVSSFHIDKSGLPKDRNSVFVYDPEMGRYRPTTCGIDVRTAEYFVHKRNGHDGSWMRDKDFVYLDERRVDVDRTTFAPFGSYWWTDKNYVYRDGYDSSSRKQILIRVDTLRSPLDTLAGGCYYLRNGRNIIYMGTVVATDVDAERFEDIGVSKCVVGDMLFYNGERILKDSLDVAEARFYFYGHIAADKHHVFYIRKLLDDIDAASFHQINDEVFEDRNYRYTIKENVWQEEYPFDKQKLRD